MSSPHVECGFLLPICPIEILEETPCLSVCREAGSKPPSEADVGSYGAGVPARVHPCAATRLRSRRRRPQRTVSSAKVGGKQRRLAVPPEKRIPLACHSYKSGAGSPGALQQRALAVPASSLVTSTCPPKPWRRRKPIGEAGFVTRDAIPAPLRLWHAAVRACARRPADAVSPPKMAVIRDTQSKSEPFSAGEIDAKISSHGDTRQCVIGWYYADAQRRAGGADRRP